MQKAVARGLSTGPSVACTDVMGVGASFIIVRYQVYLFSVGNTWGKTNVRTPTSLTTTVDTGMTWDSPIVVLAVNTFVTLPPLSKKSVWTVRPTASPMSPHLSGEMIMPLSLE